MSHNSTAKAVRLRKAERPELYCINRECLHRAPCPKHGNTEKQAMREEQHARYIDCGPQAWDDRN